MPRWVHSQLGGYGAMVASAMVFAVMGGLVRYAEDIDTYTKVLFRFAVGMVVLGVMGIGGRIRFDFHNHKLLVLRGVMGAFVVTFYFIAIDKVGLGKGSIIFYSFPVFATINSALILKEKVAIDRWAAILVAFFGLYLTISGGQKLSGGFGVYELVAVGGAFGAGIVAVIIKKLRETDSAYSIYFSQSAFGFLFLMLWMIFSGDLSGTAQDSAAAAGSGIGIQAVSSGMGVLLLLLIGLAAAGAHLLMTWGYRHVPVSGGTLSATLSPVFCAIVAVLFFDEPIGVQTGVGMLIVLVTCGYVVGQAAKGEVEGDVEVGD